MEAAALVVTVNFGLVLLLSSVATSPPKVSSPRRAPTTCPILSFSYGVASAHLRPAARSSSVLSREFRASVPFPMANTGTFWVEWFPLGALTCEKSVSHPSLSCVAPVSWSAVTIRAVSGCSRTYLRAMATASSVLWTSLTMPYVLSEPSSGVFPCPKWSV